MAEKTAIAWTRSTFNPWIGCTKVGPGCDHCYAETLDKRHKWGGAVHWGSGVPRYRTKPANWNQPLKWDAFAKAERLLGERRPDDEWEGPLGFWPVFCASLADVFDNEVPHIWQAELWELIKSTPNLSWLLVTKRIGNVEKFVPWGWIKDGFPDNVRLLITVCNQEEADRDIPKLLALRCKNGISYEPALGRVDWSPWLDKAPEIGQGAPNIGFFDDKEGEQRIQKSNAISNPIDSPNADRLPAMPLDAGAVPHDSPADRPLQPFNDLTVGVVDRDSNARRDAGTPPPVNVALSVKQPGDIGDRAVAGGNFNGHRIDVGSDSPHLHAPLDKMPSEGSPAYPGLRTNSRKGLAGFVHSDQRGLSHNHHRTIEWLIVGGESTQGAGKARPFDLAWARSTVAQCKAAGVPVFVKQIGSNIAPVVVEAVSVRDRLFVKHRAGADPAEWPEALRVQEFPA